MFSPIIPRDVNRPLVGSVSSSISCRLHRASYAPPVPPPWHRVTGTWRAFGASAPTTPRLLWSAPVSCVACRELPEKGILSRHLFFSPAVDLADAIDLFGAGPDLDDDDGIIDGKLDAAMAYYCPPLFVISP
ncbi:unnamed protein product [Boreogadus saida]